MHGGQKIERLGYGKINYVDIEITRNQDGSNVGERGSEPGS